MRKMDQRFGNLSKITEPDMAFEFSQVCGLIDVLIRKPHDPLNIVVLLLEFSMVHCITQGKLHGQLA